MSYSRDKTRLCDWAEGRKGRVFLGPCEVSQASQVIEVSNCNLLCQELSGTLAMRPFIPDAIAR